MPLFQPGLAVEPYELEITGPKPHEALIKVTHCSVGRGDVSFLRNDYEIPDLNYPLVAGHELVVLSKRLETRLVTLLWVIM
jgi:D-arabinose 1-dehydrogenase-like Zn-dependent alcohol dehydrogenase